MAPERELKGKYRKKACSNGVNVRTNGANVRTNDANVRTNDANVRTNDANVRTNGANVRTNGANVRTNNVNVRTNGVNVRTNDANVRTNDVNVRTNNVNVRTNNGNMHTNNGNHCLRPKKAHGKGVFQIVAFRKTPGKLFSRWGGTEMYKGDSHTEVLKKESPLGDFILWEVRWTRPFEIHPPGKKFESVKIIALRNMS
jgi:hypothetical protein